MDDYYELLGIEEDAPVDDIRTAYRDKKAAIDTSTNDAAKADVAALNKAWNVLSDPYQRGRYDQQRLDTDDGADDDDVDDDDDDEDAAPVRRRRPTSAAPASARETRAEQRRKAREPRPPTIKLPAGVHLPENRRRLVAMSIDVFVLLLVFVGSQLLVVSQQKAKHPVAYKQVTKVLPDEISNAHDVTSKANKAESAAKDKLAAVKKLTGTHSTEIDEAQATLDKATLEAGHKKRAYDNLNKEFTRQSKVLAPISRLISALFFVVVLLYLLVPSLLLHGQTPGKRSQKVRVARMDGSPARAGDILRRYGLLVLSAYALSILVGPPGALVVVFVATMWTRNPNRQGLHDRLAKTLVVADDDV